MHPPAPNKTPTEKERHSLSAASLLAAVSNVNYWRIQSFYVNLYDSPDSTKAMPVNLVQWCKQEIKHISKVSVLSKKSINQFYGKNR